MGLSRGQASLMGGHTSGGEDGKAGSSPEQQDRCPWRMDTEGVQGWETLRFSLSSGRRGRRTPNI